MFENLKLLLFVFASFSCFFSFGSKINRNCNCNEIKICVKSIKIHFESCEKKCEKKIPIRAFSCFFLAKMALKNLTETPISCFFNPQNGFCFGSQVMNQAPPSQNIGGSPLGEEDSEFAFHVWKFKNEEKMHETPDLKDYNDCMKNCSEIFKNFAEDWRKNKSDFPQVDPKVPGDQEDQEDKNIDKEFALIHQCSNKIGYAVN